MSDNLPAKDSKSLFTKEEEEEEEEAMWDFLPPEILPIILLRLPTKSIVKDAMFSMKTHTSAQITQNREKRQTQSVQNTKILCIF